MDSYAKKTLQYRSDRRPFGENFTVLPIVSPAGSESSAGMFGNIRRPRQMQIHTGGRNSAPLTRRFPVFLVMLASETKLQWMLSFLRIFECFV
jgi:hypothetical protein